MRAYTSPRNGDVSRERYESTSARVLIMNKKMLRTSILRTIVLHLWCHYRITDPPLSPFFPPFLETRGAATSYGALSALPHREMRFYTLRAVLHSGGNRPTCIKQINYLPVYRSSPRARARALRSTGDAGDSARREASFSASEKDRYAYA